ncbi:hypothetical protein ED769_14975 [Escherichia coli]|nr:hypothetical protein [Escherichia coli]
MKTFTREQLVTLREAAEAAKGDTTWQNLQAFRVAATPEVVLALLNVLDASLDVKPVASCIVEDGNMCVDGFSEYVGHSLPDGMHELYAAPPVPDKLPREYIRGWPLAHSDYAEGWNDCREAMLKGGA